MARFVRFLLLCLGILVLVLDLSCRFAVPTKTVDNSNGYRFGKPAMTAHFALNEAFLDSAQFQDNRMNIYQMENQLGWFLHGPQHPN